MIFSFFLAIGGFSPSSLLLAIVFLLFAFIAAAVATLWQRDFVVADDAIAATVAIPAGRYCCQLTMPLLLLLLLRQVDIVGTDNATTAADVVSLMLCTCCCGCTVTSPVTMDVSVSIS